jgi:hypothetical protein
MIFWAIIVIGLLVVVANGLFADTAWAYTLREMIRGTPGTREMWIGDGRWVAFSKRFGSAYGIAAVAIAFLWVLAGTAVLPDTVLTFWLIFGPSLVLLVIGVVILMLRFGRWLGDE